LEAENTKLATSRRRQVTLRQTHAGTSATIFPRFSSLVPHPCFTKAYDFLNRKYDGLDSRQTDENTSQLFF
jgi:hypothetical protein